MDIKQRDEILEAIRVIPNYPKNGIMFRDITTLVNNKIVFGNLIEFLKNRYSFKRIDFVAGLEARGFIFGSALAYALGVGFVPIRKSGKLPYKSVSASYELEYGKDEIEIHIDAFRDLEGARVILIDDLIATGGTAKAGIKLIQSIGGKCVEACFLINLTEFRGFSEVKNLVNAYSILDL